MKYLPLFFALALSLPAEPSCLNGQGPLQEGQMLCSFIWSSVSDYIEFEPKAIASITKEYILWDERGKEPRWISIEDGKVELSPNLSMEQALILIYEDFTSEQKRQWAEGEKLRKEFNLHLRDDVDGLNRIQDALKGRPVPMEPLHKRERPRI